MGTLESQIQLALHFQDQHRSLDFYKLLREKFGVIVIQLSLVGRSLFIALGQYHRFGYHHSDVRNLGRHIVAFKYFLTLGRFPLWDHKIGDLGNFVISQLCD